MWMFCGCRLIPRAAACWGLVARRCPCLLGLSSRWARCPASEPVGPELALPVGPRGFAHWTVGRCEAGHWADGVLGAAVTPGAVSGASAARSTRLYVPKPFCKFAEWFPALRVYPRELRGCGCAPIRGAGRARVYLRAGSRGGSGRGGHGSLCSGVAVRMRGGPPFEGADHNLDCLGNHVAGVPPVLRG